MVKRNLLRILNLALRDFEYVILGVILFYFLYSYYLSPPPTVSQGKQYTTDMPGVTWTTIKVSGEHFLIVKDRGGDIEVLAVRGR